MQLGVTLKLIFIQSAPINHWCQKLVLKPMHPRIRTQGSIFHSCFRAEISP